MQQVENYRHQLFAPNGGRNMRQIALDAVQILRLEAKIAEVERRIFLDALVKAAGELRNMPGKELALGLLGANRGGSPNERALFRIVLVVVGAKQIHKSLLEVARLDGSDAIIDALLRAHQKQWETDYTTMKDSPRLLQAVIDHPMPWWKPEAYFWRYEELITLQMLSRWYDIYREVPDFDFDGAMTTMSVQLNGAELRRKLRIEQLTKLASPAFDGEAIRAYYKNLLH